MGARRTTPGLGGAAWLSLGRIFDRGERRHPRATALRRNFDCHRRCHRDGTSHPAPLESLGCESRRTPYNSKFRRLCRQPQCLCVPVAGSHGAASCLFSSLCEIWYQIATPGTAMGVLFAVWHPAGWPGMDRFSHWHAGGGDGAASCRAWPPG